MLRPGVHVAKYRLDRRLGRGAFAEVWRARDTVESRWVALKLLFPEVVREQGRKSLQREAQIGASLLHPNIVGTRNADWVGDRLFIACDLAETNLAEYTRAHRSGEVALRIVADVARGLAHAHERGIIHRDVKPENVLIFGDGRAAIADFGVSRLASSTTTAFTEAGTLGYVAPEQAYGRPSLGSDVFSLGLIAYELLGGHLARWPFKWPPPGIERFEQRVPEPVQPVLRKAAEFEPRRRYADAIELSRALECGLRLAAAASSRPRPRRRRKRAPPQSALAAQAHTFCRAHGARLQMHTACYRCGLPVAESMRCCPWCGFEENGFSEATSAALICPDCERGVQPEWRACPWCYTGLFEGNGRPLRPDPRAVRTCSRKGCDAGLRPFMRYCPACKQKVSRPWIDPELPHRCPRCRWSVSRHFWHYCPWCCRRERDAGSFDSLRGC